MDGRRIDAGVVRVAGRVRDKVSALPTSPRADVSWLPEPGPDEERVALPGLSPVEVDVLIAAGLIEVDIRYGALFAALQEPLASRRPCIGLVAWLLGEDEVTSTCHALVRRGLLAVDNMTDPRSEWVLRVPVPVWDAVRTGHVAADTLPPQLHLRSGFPPPSDVAVAPGQADLPERMPGLLADPGLSALVLRGPRGSGRTTLLGSAAATLGLDLLVHDGPVESTTWQIFEALATLCPVLPVVRVDPSPGETLSLPTLHAVGRPLGVVAGRSGGLSGEPLKHALTVSLEPPGPAARRRLWTEEAPDDEPDGCAIGEADLADIVERFLLTPGNIRRASPIAQLQARAAGRRWVVADDVRAATRTLGRQELETLATYLAPLPTSTEPVLSPAAEAEFVTLLRRCRRRERLTEAAAVPGLSRGVRALFSGGSGTGKTLAARHLAARLDLDLYRIDLAAVVNKYIGETERNLDQVLARAEELDVVLLLDEGDALMTRRTDVSSANDRYANLETNFLLQRLETFDGIVVVTSNAAGRIDPAFLRRIDVTVEFVAPDADQRWQIWAAHLPPDHAVAPNLLDEVARRCSLTGGQIRNAALHATMLAVDADVAVGDDQLLEGVRREYRRSGASSPLTLTDGRRPSRDLCWSGVWTTGSAP